MVTRATENTDPSCHRATGPDVGLGGSRPRYHYGFWRLCRLLYPPGPRHCCVSRSTSVHGAQTPLLHFLSRSPPSTHLSHLSIMYSFTHHGSAPHGPREGTWVTSGLAAGQGSHFVFLLGNNYHTYGEFFENWETFVTAFPRNPFCNFHWWFLPKFHCCYCLKWSSYKSVGRQLIRYDF